MLPLPGKIEMDDVVLACIGFASLLNLVFCVLPDQGQLLACAPSRQHAMIVLHFVRGKKMVLFARGKRRVPVWLVLALPQEVLEHQVKERVAALFLLSPGGAFAKQTAQPRYGAA